MLDDFTNISLRNVKLILNRNDLRIDTLLYEYNTIIKKIMFVILLFRYIIIATENIDQDPFDVWVR